MTDESGRYYSNGVAVIDPIPEPLLWGIAEGLGMNHISFATHYLNIIVCHELMHNLGEEHFDDGLSWNILIEKGFGL